VVGLNDGRWGSIKGGKALQALLSTAAWSAQFSRQWRQRRTTLAGTSLERDTVGQHASWPLPRVYTSSAWFLLPFRSQSVAAVQANFLLGALVLLSSLGDAIADLQKNTVAEGLEAFNSVLPTSKKMAVAERKEAEPTTGRRNDVGLAVRQVTIELLAQSCRQSSSKPITVSCRSHAEPLQPTMRFPEIFGPLAWAGRGHGEGCGPDL